MGMTNKDDRIHVLTNAGRDFYHTMFSTTPDYNEMITEFVEGTGPNDTNTPVINVRERTPRERKKKYLNATVSLITKCVICKRRFKLYMDTPTFQETKGDLHILLQV